MPSIRELRRSQRTTSSFYDTWFTRKVSVYVTAVALPLGVTPNAVSAFNLLVGLAGWTLIALDAHPIVGAALIHLYAVLDSVDGELARHTGRFSLQGMFLEDYSAYLMISGYWLAMGLYLGRALATPIPMVLAVALVSFGRSGMPVARRVLLASLQSRRRFAVGLEAPHPVAPTTLVGATRFVFEDIMHPSHMWALSTIVLVSERLWYTGSTALLVLVSFYFVLSIVKELAVVLRMGFGRTLEGELAHLRDDVAYESGQRTSRLSDSSSDETSVRP